MIAGQSRRPVIKHQFFRVSMCMRLQNLMLQQAKTVIVIQVASPTRDSDLPTPHHPLFNNLIKSTKSDVALGSVAQ